MRRKGALPAEGTTVVITIVAKLERYETNGVGRLYISPTGGGFIRYLHPHFVVRIRKATSRGLRKLGKG